MKGRSPTVEEIQWIDDICNLETVRCVVCWFCDGVSNPRVSSYHIDGRIKPDTHLLTIALCSKHHQEKDNQKSPRWISRHGDGKKAVEERYGTELEFLELTSVLVRAKRNVLKV
ncbi:Ref family recombination enhancement nuclease [Pseudoteredinibacter isoporae]|uniref:Ref family recombination enhancement nuclease n=1 Tax=Pseudoteredinibacter isoporae TaxID=570281 RepID=UPI003341E90F